MKFNKMFKIAESKGHTNVGIIGEDEVKNQTITLKNMKTRNQHNTAWDNSSEMIKFLKDS